MGLDNVLGHLVLGIGKVNGGLVLLGDPLVDQRAVSRAKVVQSPNGADPHVEASAVEMAAAVGAAAKDAAVEIAAGAGASHDDAGEQRAKLLLPHAIEARLHQRSLRANSGRFVKPTGTRSATGKSKRDQRHLKMRRLHGDDHRAGV